MKLIYHHRTLAGDAQGIHIDKMIRAFKELGHHVETVALVSSRSDKIPDGGTAGGKWIRLIKKTPQWCYELSAIAYNLVGLCMLDQAIRRVKPDFIYERYALNTFCGVIAAQCHGIPLILEVNAPLRREQESLGQLAFKQLARFTEKWICSHATHTIVVTKALQELLAEDGISLGKLTVMHNGIDPTEINPGIKGYRVRERYSLGDSTVIGFVGWFRKWHGLEMLFDASVADEIKRRGVRVLLIGEGPAKEELCQMVSDRGLDKVVTFTGPVAREEMAEHIAAMDIALQPSAPPYACPMKIIEYMGMARCIIAPRQPNVLEMLDESSSALLFDPHSPSSLREAIIQAVCDPGLRLRIAQNGYKNLQSRGYYWTRNAERVLALLFKQDGRTPNLKPLSPNLVVSSSFRNKSSYNEKWNDKGSATRKP
jgi:glycosyltransferase involved in cell wall biosynthesis